MTRPADDSRVVRVQCLPAPQEEPGPFDDGLPLTPEQARTIFAFALFTKPISPGEPAPSAQNNKTRKVQDK